jgi:preprotein translocase subunit SecY
MTLPPGAHPDDTMWWMQTVLILIAGTMFVMWLGERITDKGLGNGISLIIMIGIIASLPSAFATELISRHNNGGFVILLVEVAMLLLVILATILLVQGTRRIPFQSAKSIVSARGGRMAQMGGTRQYIPLKVNQAGVMPIIFAQAIMIVPGYIGQFTGITFFNEFANFQGFWYNALLATLIIAFTYFYTAITFNPNQLADEMKRSGAFIPGVKPGKKTADFIDSLLSRITLPGSIFLALIAILPAFAMQFGVKQQFAMFFGGTSLLIMVGVVLDTLQQIETHLLMRQYDGLMKGGRIQGRQTATSSEM